MHGRVQGVGFRFRAREEAVRLGLTGHVRNALDGTVEVELEGAEDVAGLYLAWLAKGPRFAHVESLDIIELEPIGDRGFRVS